MICRSCSVIVSSATRVTTNARFSPSGRVPLHWGTCSFESLAAENSGSPSTIVHTATLSMCASVRSFLSWNTVKWQVSGVRNKTPYNKCPSQNTGDFAENIYTPENFQDDLAKINSSHKLVFVKNSWSSKNSMNLQCKWAKNNLPRSSILRKIDDPEIFSQMRSNIDESDKIPNSDLARNRWPSLESLVLDRYS